MGRYVRQNKVRTTIVHTLDEAEDDHFRDCPPAEIRQRIGAFLLDIIFLGLLLSGISKLFQPAFVLLSEPNSAMSDWRSLVLAGKIASHVTCVFLYQVVCLVRYGGQPGKLMFELRVANLGTGQKLNFPQALLREIFLKPLSILLLGVGLWFIWRRPDRRSLHDLLAHTEVKRNEPHQ